MCIQPQLYGRRTLGFDTTIDIKIYIGRAKGTSIKYEYESSFTLKSHSASRGLIKDTHMVFLLLQCPLRLTIVTDTPCSIRVGGVGYRTLATIDVQLRVQLTRPNRTRNFEYLYEISCKADDNEEEVSKERREENG